MAVMRCTGCGELNRVDLGGIPVPPPPAPLAEGEEPPPPPPPQRVKCHSCGHDAPVPPSKERNAIERTQARQRRQVLVGAVCFLLAIVVWYLRGWLLEFDPANELVKTGLLVASSVLATFALVQTIVHESTRHVCEF